ncbi:uncharacterized protein CLUP02_01899 [Colletotrichum lupini]|uniref:Uncharacterized protein n=1 Tax=Colletotrichum lupini TaxID=145971 RepID=A0A9Q8W9Q4_9PEZI|nr:uncharacterized protein CLUP02_01899 [Colletotrichum lupini]KAK1712105.1 hypothetical protein BDP67DRAFT_517951 [Colletotrichum lupini]UQC75246.1 hypothetical protein CLUP02_01899 [Colletotrichum lupini]
MKLRPMSLNRGKVCTRAASLHLRLLLFTLSLFHVSHPSYSTVYNTFPHVSALEASQQTHTHTCVSKDPQVPKTTLRPKLGTGDISGGPHQL